MTGLFKKAVMADYHALRNRVYAAENHDALTCLAFAFDGGYLTGYTVWLLASPASWATG